MMNQRPTVPEITADDVHTRLTGAPDDQPVIVDVREPDEWIEGHIKQAMHIPLNLLGTLIHEIPTDRDVVVVCHSGQRSAFATAALMREGFDRAINLQGGMVAWEKRQFPIETGE